MSPLPSQISERSVEQAFEMLDTLWESLEAHAATLNEKQSAELERRVAKYDQDASRGAPSEPARATFLER